MELCTNSIIPNFLKTIMESVDLYVFDTLYTSRYFILTKYASNLFEIRLHTNNFVSHSFHWLFKYFILFVH